MNGRVQAAPAEQALPTATGGSVLVVEDEERIRKLVSVALGRAGYSVTTAVDGAEALERIAEATPDLVVSDVMMPHLDGLELLRRLREAPATRAIPVILLTAKGTTEDVVAGLEYGADDYLAKPFQTPELLARVQAKIERPSVPAELLPQDRQTGLVSNAAFRDEVAREVKRLERTRGSSIIGVFQIDREAGADLSGQVTTLLREMIRPHGLAGRDAAGRFLVLLPDTTAREAKRRFKGLTERFSPRIGLVPITPGASVEQLLTEGMAALDHAPPVAAPEPGTRGRVLVVEDEEGIRKLVSVTLERAGYTVVTAQDGEQALRCVAETPPHLIVSDVMMPRLDGLRLLERLRDDPATRTIPLIFLTAKGGTEDVVAGLRLGADDYLAKPFQTPELLARVQAKIERPSVPAELLPQDRQTGLLSERNWVRQAQRELARANARGAPGCMAYLNLNELPSIRARFGTRGEAEVAKQTAALIGSIVGEPAVIGRDAEGRFLLLLPHTAPSEAKRLLSAVSQQLVRHRFTVGNEGARLTPTTGFGPFAPGSSVELLRNRALVALEHAALHLDLQPVRYHPKLDAATAQRAAEAKAAKAARPWATFLERVRIPFQIAVTALVGLVIPFFIYAALARYWMDITHVMYLVVVVGLLLTAILIWVEGFLALRRADPPEEPGTPYPPASAIIAAYLPNEAATIVETVEAFLRIEYPAPLQIILAYNTPRDLHVETVLREMAERDPRFVPLRVQFSTSKAQNVNAALSSLTGAFVGVFDADHHPQPDSFTRAWRWLSNGWDVVQGHCLIRNGEASWVARMTAVEFEAMYSIAHPGRARLHNFGIFGGSNGYWKTDLLRQIRMHGFMLTEDIDSSLRVVEAGYKIQSDPHLISRELAPAEFKALWNQRLRWAQGWFQVSMNRFLPGLRSPRLSLRQKLGLFHLLAWREAFPWLSLQIFPILAFWIWSRGFENIDWFVPIFVATTLFTLGTGPGQAFFLYRLAAAEIRKRRGWIPFYVIASFFFYTEIKNLIARLAQVKEAMRERAWKVTPRAGAKKT